MYRAAIDWYQRWLQFRCVEVMLNQGYLERRTYARQQWAELSAGDKARWCLKAKDDLPGIPFVEVTIDEDEDDNDENRTQGVLLTFHGDWGLDNPNVTSLQPLIQCDILAACALLREMPYYIDLCSNFFTRMLDVGEFFNFPQLSVALELCPNAENTGRVHLHAFLSGSERMRMTKVVDTLRFDGVKPCHVQSCVARKSIGAGKRLNEGHYYLQCPKIGVILQKTNWPKWTSFPVAKRWIMNQFKVRKMLLEDARAECLEARDGVRGSFSELDCIAEELRKQDMTKESEYLQTMLKKQMKQFKALPKAILDWKEQYVPYMCHGQVQHTRFRPLVLDGPTRFGKTSMAKALFGENQTLVLQCQGVAVPCLKHYMKYRQRYKCILFDEAHWTLVHDNKMLFQGGPAPVTLGQSPTGQFCYDVLLYGVPMILCSNQFLNGADDLQMDYLTKNLIIVSVTEQCWLD